MYGPLRALDVGEALSHNTTQHIWFACLLTCVLVVAGAAYAAPGVVVMYVTQQQQHAGVCHACAGVRRTSLTVLSHLILNDMMKVSCCVLDDGDAWYLLQHNILGISLL
jgi:hypothetical protein